MVARWRFPLPSSNSMVSPVLSLSTRNAWPDSSSSKNPSAGFAQKNRCLAEIIDQKRTFVRLRRNKNQMAPAKIVFLYTELAGYFLACVEALSKNAEVMIVRWPVNKEAPFQFSTPGSVKIYNRNEWSD